VQVPQLQWCASYRHVVHTYVPRTPAQHSIVIDSWLASSPSSYPCLSSGTKGPIGTTIFRPLVERLRAMGVKVLGEPHGVA
jgi:hypothetical protein